MGKRNKMSSRYDKNQLSGKAKRVESVERALIVVRESFPHYEIYKQGSCASWTFLKKDSKEIVAEMFMNKNNNWMLRIK